jgi:hypothetical protein
MSIKKWLARTFLRAEYLGDQRVSKDLLAEIDEHILLGKKVNAIKALRAATGLGLKESKTLIDVRYTEVLHIEPVIEDDFEHEVAEALGEVDEAQIVADIEAGSLHVTDGSVEEASPETIGDLIKDQMESAHGTANGS